MGRRRTSDPHAISPAVPEPSPPRPSPLTVTEQTLDNGLKVLVLPRPRASIVVCDLYYPVGSADEPVGKTGLAHFVEHMLFKGTARFPKGYIDRLTFAAGGEANAETGEDFTHYWFRLPRERWEMALAVEADRMRGALFDPAEVEAERQVIAEELARDHDSPAGRLDEQFLAHSYKNHPYRNPILGWPDDLLRLSPADLKSFYQRHYRPAGAVLVLVGDLDPAAALERVIHHFGRLPRGPSLRPFARPRSLEPPQKSRRSFRLADADGIARGLLGWHTVPRGHADNPPLTVLADLLCCGRRSRLWDRLVERERLATHVDAEQDAGHLAGQFVISIEALPDADPDLLESIVLDEIQQLAQTGPDPAELARSRTRLEAAWRWQQDDLIGLAAGLGSTSLWSDWRTWPAEHEAAIALQPSDLRHVASTYFSPTRLTAGWSLPRPRARSSAPSPQTLPSASPNPSPPPSSPRPQRLPAIQIPPLIHGLAEFHPMRWRLPNGLRVLAEPVPGTAVVAAELYVEAGQRVEHTPGVAYLAGRLREEGTARLPADKLAEAIEDVGGSLDLYAKGGSLHVRAEDLPLALDVLADVSRRPAFPPETLPWLRRRVATELRADQDDPAFRADALFRRLVYGTHPYGRDPRGNLRQIAQLSLDDIRRHHRRFFRPDNAILVVVGDFNLPTLRRLVRSAFGSWKPPARTLLLPHIPPPPSPRALTRRVEHPGEQVHLVLGHLGIPRRHPDFDALAVLDHILGSGPGFTDRLSASLRDDLGLAYSVSGGITDSADLEPGTFRVYVGTSPDLLDLAVSAVLEQIQAMHLGLFSDDEVEQAKQYLRGSCLFDFQGISQRADRLVELAAFGLPLSEPLRWPARLDRITPARVRAAARRHLHPNALVRVALGPLGRSRKLSRTECA